MNLYFIFWKSLLWFIVYFSWKQVNNQVVAKHARSFSGNHWIEPAPEYPKKKSSEETTEINILYDDYDLMKQTPRVRIKKHKEKEPEKKRKKKERKEKLKHHVETKDTSKKGKVNAKKHKKKKNHLPTHHKVFNSLTTRRVPIRRENFTHYQKIKHKGSPVDIMVHIKMNDDEE